MKNSHLVAPVFLAGTNNLPQMQSAPYVIVTNGADRFTLYSNFLPIDRCGEGDGAGDVEVVGEGTAVYLFGQAVVAGREVEQADMAIDGGGAVGGYGAEPWAATVLRTEVKPKFLGNGICCQWPSVSRSMVYSCP